MVREGTAIPNRALEKHTPINNEVRVYTLSESELEEIRRKYPSEKLAYEKPSGTAIDLEEHWLRRNPLEIPKVKIPRSELTKEKYLELKELGYSDVQIVRMVEGFHINYITRLKHKWGLIGIFKPNHKVKS